MNINKIDSSNNVLASKIENLENPILISLPMNVADARIL